MKTIMRSKAIDLSLVAFLLLTGIQQKTKGYVFEPIPIHTLIHKNDLSGSLALSPNGKYVASGLINGTIIVWDVVSGKKVKRLKGHRDSVDLLTWSPDSTKIASHSEDETIRIWKAVSWKKISKIQNIIGILKHNIYIYVCVCIARLTYSIY